MNVLRLPFTYFEMLNDDGSLKSTAFDRLDWFIREAEKRELYVILDLHGAPGSQNGKDHSGDTSHSDGGNLYGNKENMKDRKSTRLNSSHVAISYAVFCLKKK